MPIQRQNVLADLIYETESGQIAEERIWPFSFCFIAARQAPSRPYSPERFLPPKPKEKKVHLAFDLFLIELPIYKAGSQGMD